jgi:hypothetical protein
MPDEESMTINPDHTVYEIGRPRIADFPRRLGLKEGDA